MFYKFNTLTQSLVSTTQDVATERTVTPLTSLKESPEVHYEFKPLTAPKGPSTGVRHASSAALELHPGQYAVPNTPAYRKLMEIQAKFLAHDGHLVWQKLPRDKPFYYLTFGLVALSVVLSGLALKTFTSPPKNE